jgi:outer membrane protein assembly factor BamB
MPSESSSHDTGIKHPEAQLLFAGDDREPATSFKLENVANPLSQGTLGDLGLATRVSGPASFAPIILRQQYHPRALTGIDPATVKMFRWDETTRMLEPIWNSGANVGLGFIWAKIRRPGTYVPVGLPRDRVLQEFLRTLARKRRTLDGATAQEHKELTASVFAAFLKGSEVEWEALRRLLATVEVQTSHGQIAETEIQRGRGYHILAFALPKGASPAEFRERVSRLEVPTGGLPEESLFFAPDLVDTLGPEFQPADLLNVPHLKLPPFPICWLWSQDWWMYHHDAEHSGHASGCSSIRSTNVAQMILWRTVALPGAGTVWTIPTIVAGKIYAGTVDNPGGGGTLYKVDLTSGAVEKTFGVAMRTPAYSQGIGGSPAVVNGKVYFTDIPGRVYCIDANTFALQWMTDLRNRDLPKNQPVQNIPGTDSWASPVVANGKVYVGCGEGEAGAFGFVYCLDAASGNVLWLFCTNQFVDGTDNNPNVIPASTAAGLTPAQLQAMGFTSHADPPQKGVSVWSSCAYDSVLNRIYVGTGNSASADFKPLPDTRYGSGVLSLDANTGAFRGYFQPLPGDSYRPNDTDVDVCGSPTVFSREGTRVLGIGCKNGSYFLLDPATVDPKTGLMQVLARRQLLPYLNNNPATPIPTVDPGATMQPDENKYGVFGTAALHYGLGKLFVGLGGYAGGDTPSTPFVRALDWNSLADAWPAALGPDGVTRYTMAKPPLYTNAGETGLSSPAVVNDIVFVSTNKPALYALDVVNGHSIWLAPGLSGQPAGTFVLGPAIYGNYVVIGCGGSLFIYSLFQIIIRWPPWLVPPIPVPIPLPGPVERS